MKTALLVPAWKPTDIFPAGTAGSQINYWQPLGTLYVAAAIRKAGYQVGYFDGAFLSHSALLQSVEKFGPSIVGIYSTTFGWKRALKTAADIKKKLNDVFVIVGGPYPTVLREKCLLESPNIDAVAFGEAEETIVELLERLKHGLSLSGLRGLAFREKERIISNPARPFQTDLDSIAYPARDLLGDRQRYIPPPGTYRRKPVALIITSRGCNRRCLYCFQMDRERRSGIRRRSVESVLDEIEYCLKNGYREIKFIDDTLAADRGRALDIARGIISRKLNFTWFASACANQVDMPLLEAFRMAGCWAILIGAESGVLKNLNAIRKGITPDQIRRAVKCAKEAGLKVFTPFIFGIPGETYEEGLRTIEFACELDPHVASFHALTPFPGTDLYDQAAHYGALSENLEDYTYQGVAFVPHSMTRKEIFSLRREAYRRFYSRPGYLMKQIAGIRTLHDLKAGGNGLRSLLSLWNPRRLLTLKDQKQRQKSPVAPLTGRVK